MLKRAGLTVAAVACFTLNASAEHWPAFRGTHARGVSDASTPTTWDAPKRAGIRWHAAIPGLSHASPIVWGDRVYVISAVGGSELDRTPASGGSVVFATDTVAHEWQLHCLDAATGATRWSRTVHTGTPRQARHVRGTYANATPATDGRVIVASLGNEGLFGFDMEGARLWHVEMTPPAPNASLDPASSPVIAGDVAIVQNDWSSGSFAAAYDLESGRERWRVARDEGMVHSTPGLWPSSAGTQVVFNSARWIRAHDAASGRELWRMNNAIERPWDRVPTPVPSGSLLLVGGGGPQGLLLAVRAGGAGEIRAEAGPSAPLAWRVERGAPYLPTPLVYNGLVYAVADNGVMTVYREADGSLVYRTRIAADSGTISASPIAAGGRIYISSQDGDIFVVGAGETFNLLARNSMGEPLYATPAVAGNLLIVRTASGVYGIGAPSTASPQSPTVKRPAPARTEIAKGVYLFQTAPYGIGLDGNSVAIIGDDGVLVFDTNGTPSAAEAVLADIRALTPKPIRYIVNSHWHWDHWYGTQVYRDAFPDAQVIAHEKTRQMMAGPAIDFNKPGMEEQLPGYIKSIEDRIAKGEAQTPRPDNLPRLRQALAEARFFFDQKLSVKHVLPGKTFTKSMTLDLGGRKVEVRHHDSAVTPGDAFLYLPDEKILITGDLLVNPVTFALSSYPTSWLATLEHLDAL
ncbi:MAG: PQQ-binding-like beta-propeller repeat protein, partial [Acidobacteriota bacterium]|nr:PQQ-binding-like beta-propeller repeat protein [Acidobacteriota bacterium]